MRLVLWALVATVIHHVGAANMNGEYVVANAPSFSTAYNAEYFDVYSPPIRSRYSEVFWRRLDNVPLPVEIQERFANKTMAIIGYEVDQVQRRDDKEDMPVPITWAYNHHYEAFLSNTQKTKLVKKQGNRPGVSHGKNEYWTTVLKSDSDDGTAGVDGTPIPLMQIFSEANGGEFRKSYHGYPKNYAQLIDSPDTFIIIPMQIDTWNRDAKASEFKPGPLPKNSGKPPSAGYSGLIECPCSDRLPKKWSMSYALEADQICAAAIQNASECFSGARQVVTSSTGSYVERTVFDASKPQGCFAVPHADGSMDLVWNKVVQESSLGKESESKDRIVAFASAKVNITVALAEEENIATITIVGPGDRWFGVGFGTSSMCLHMEGDECPGGGPYAILVMGDEINERKLGFHGPGVVLEDSLTVQSNVVEDGFRTVILTRSLNGASSSHYTFDLSAVPSIPIITATGCAMSFAQHCGHGPAELHFLAVGMPAPICEAGTAGTLGDGGLFRNHGRCAPFPTSDLLTQQNPTCFIETYVGGLSCCRDGQPLLDQDQEVPWADQYLEYHLKFRFYFEDYKPALIASGKPSHHSLVRLYSQTEAHAGEYDITQCPEGTPPDQCVQVITSRWKVSDMMLNCSIREDASRCTGEGGKDPDRTKGVELIYAGPHCHAPSCLSMELYNADTGQLLCHVEPIFGRGNDKDNYDESGFVAIPPCLWGAAEEGLPRPVFLPLNTTLLSIKRNNNTMGHTGEMASWQMRGIVIPREKPMEAIEPSLKVTTVGRGYKGRGAPSADDSPA